MLESKTGYLDVDMRTVGAYEAKTHFGELLSEVENGETVVVTRRGVAVARIVPVRGDFEDAAVAIEEWRQYRREHNVTLGSDTTIRELIAEGRE